MSSTPKPAAVSSDSKALHYFTRIVVVLVAIGAAVLSFDALTALAVESGVPPLLAWVWAVVIDGFILVSTLAAFAMKDRVGSAKYYAWITLGVFVVFSILGNAWHAVIEKEAFELPIFVAVIVTAVPPLALFLAIHLLVLMVSPTPEQKLDLKRKAEHQERLNKLREKELEKIEKAAILREVKEQAQKTFEDLPYEDLLPAHKAIVAPEPVSAAPKPVIAEETTLLEVEPVKTDFMSETEVLALLDEKVENGEKLPTGKQISDMLGKAERTGQKFLKTYKDSKGIE